MMGEISILHSKKPLCSAKKQFQVPISYAHAHSYLIFGGKASSEATSLVVLTRKAFLMLLKPWRLNKMSKPVKRGASSRKHAASKAEELTARLTQWTEREMGLTRSQLPPNDDIKI